MERKEGKIMVVNNKKLETLDEIKIRVNNGELFKKSIKKVLHITNRMMMGKSFSESKIKDLYKKDRLTFDVLTSYMSYGNKTRQEVEASHISRREK